MSLGWLNTWAFADGRVGEVQRAQTPARHPRSMGQIYEQIAANLKQAKQCAICADGDRVRSRMAQEIDDFQGRIHARIDRTSKRSDFSLLRGVRGDGFNRSVRGQWDVANPASLTSSARRLHDFLLDIDVRSVAILSRATQYRASVEASLSMQMLARDSEIFDQAYAALVEDLVAVTERAMRVSDGVAQVSTEMASLPPPGEAPPPYAPPSAPAYTARQ